MWWGTVDPPLSPVKTTMAQQNVSFEIILSDPHFNLSTHTFARYTLPFDKISSILDLLASDETATHDLLALDQINQSIVALERHLDEHHQLAPLKFSSLLRHPIAQKLPQQIHKNQQPDCGCCRLRRQQPTPFVVPLRKQLLLLPLCPPPLPDTVITRCPLILDPLAQIPRLRPISPFLFNH